MGTRKKEKSMATEKAAAQGAAAANDRGEVFLPLEGVEYGLRPSREAISAIERQLRPLAVLAGEATRLELPLEDLGVIAAEMMRAYGKCHPDDPNIVTYQSSTPERLADLIFELGVPKACVRFRELLLAALLGGVTAAGEMKAQAKTPAKKRTD
jgi:hypothetical protein